MAVENILRNSVYAGLLKVESFQEFPGGLFPRFTLKEKWILNEIHKDSYNRWYSKYSTKIDKLRLLIEHLENHVASVTDIVEKNMDLLFDMEQIYNQPSLLKKRELIKLILYYVRYV